MTILNWQTLADAVYSAMNCWTNSKNSFDSSSSLSALFSGSVGSISKSPLDISLKKSRVIKQCNQFCSVMITE